MRKRWFGRVMVVAAGAMLAVMPACAGGEGMFSSEGPVDAGGLTEMEAMGGRERQFDLVRERDARMRELMTEAQEQISTDVWIWGMKGVGPSRGPSGWSVRGMGIDNSYHLSISRIIQLDGAVGAREDLDPMREYFHSKGWETEETEPGDSFTRLIADTGEGYMISWELLKNGNYILDVTSKSFWGDSSQLLSDITNRVPPEATDIEESVPGVYIDFPDWDDPADYAPKLIDDDDDDDKESGL